MWLGGSGNERINVQVDRELWFEENRQEKFVPLVCT
jgi:hypothetical protein